MPEVAAPFEAVLADLPPFPSVAVQLSTLLSVENPPIDEAVELIESDPALSADLLRRANSPAYGFASEIRSLQHCLVVLGFAEVRQLALAVSARRFAQDALRRPELERCWRNSLAVAILAERLAGVSGVSPEAAYTAGLMQDIGALSLFTARPDEYAELLRQAEEDGPIDDTEYFLRREAEIFGFDHTAAGRWLAERWGLPTTILEVVGRHHDRLQADRAQTSEAGLLEVVQVAVRAADTLGFGLTASVQGDAWSVVIGSLRESACEAVTGWDRDELERELLERTGRLNSAPPDEIPAEERAAPSAVSAGKNAGNLADESYPGLAWEVVAAAMLVAATLGGAAAVLLLRP